MVYQAFSTAQKYIIILALICISVQPTFAAGYIRCNQNETCTIGEFLYEDDYTPITDASCSLTSRQPDNNILLNAVSLTGTNDGWYAHNLSTTNLEPGVYPTELCCTHQGERLCIDKSFTINLPDLSASDISSAVWDATASIHTNPGSLGAVVQNPAINPGDIWNYSNRSLTDYGSLVTDIWNSPSRTLTGFGTLVADIWNYTSRSLTSFGSLIANIWSNPNRTLTSNTLDNGTLATTSDISQLNQAIKTDISTTSTTLQNDLATKISALHTDIATMSGNPAYANTLNKIYAQLLENRDVLEALVNEPIVKTFIDDGTPPPNLQAKIDTTKTSASELFVNTQQVVSRLGVINLKLNQMSPSALTAELNEINTLINNPKKESSSITAHLSWLEKAWGNRTTGDMSREAGEMLAAVKLAQSHLLGSSTVDTARSALITAADAGKRLEKVIGDITNSATDNTLYGHVAKIQELSQSLDQNDQALTDLLSRWQSEPPLNKDRQITQLENRVMSVNQLSNAKSIINQKGDTPDDIKKNKVLGLKAISLINRSMLAKMAGEPFSSVWLEEGSIIFRALVINPSERISQTVPLKYYLPKEIKTEDIISHDPDLEVKFDANESAVYVEGEFELAAGESRTFAVHTNDIFLIPDTTLNSLKSQAAELLKPLEKTAQYGLGATLKSDIDVIVEKIMSRQYAAQTPESRIRAYRESQIELAGASQKLDQLKNVLSDSSTSKSLFSYLGGMHAFSVWSIIIIVIAAIIFFIQYLKVLRAEAYAAAGYATIPAQTSWPTDLIQRYTDRLARVKSLPQLDTGTRLFQISFIILTASLLTVIIITTIIDPSTTAVFSAR